MRWSITPSRLLWVQECAVRSDGVSTYRIHGHEHAKHAFEHHGVIYKLTQSWAKCEKMSFFMAKITAPGV